MAWIVLITTLVLACETTGKATLRDKRSNVCYGDLGCFDTGAPFFSLLRPLNFLPEKPSVINTRFLLYTRRNQDTLHILNANDLNSVKTSYFDWHRPTKFISHGFLENGFVSWMKDMKTQLLKLGDFNVILVDWGDGSGLPYTQATANTRVVGAEIAKMIKYLQTNGNARAEDMHLIGHSLGAHICGYAGERTRNLGRISGLDPAEPYFQYTDPIVRLDPSDAQFVDVLHTDGESILKLGFGMMQAVGHVDYFPNNGEDQPGCEKGPIDTIRTEADLYGGARRYVACNHLRAIDYYTESINSICPFHAFQCDSYDNFKSGQCMPCTGNNCGIMGYHADLVKPPQGTTHVKYFLKTGSAGPFCRYHYEVRVSLSGDSGGKTWRGLLFANIFGSNGQIGENQLTDDYIELQPGKTYGFVLTSPHDIGTVTSLNFHWKHSSKVWNPLQWNILNLRHPSLNVRTLSVSYGKTAKMATFCYNGNIENQVPVNLRQLC